MDPVRTPPATSPPDETIESGAAERRLRATVEHAPVGIADRALDGRWLRVNDRLCEITGYAREELLGRSFTDIVHAEDLERERGLMDAMARGALEHYAIEKRYVRKGGAMVWVSISAALVFTPAGDPEYCVVVIEDISARKAAEEALRLSESRFRDVLRMSPVPLMLYDDAGTIVAISDAWTGLTGYRHAEIPTAAEWIRLAYRDAAPGMRAIADRVWSEPPMPHRYEHRIWTKSGEPKTVLLTAVPLGLDAAGRQLRVSAAQDLTAQRRFEHEMAEASRQKDEFIAMLSHELRNPLAAIRSATEVLQLAALDHPVVQRTQAVVARQVAHMARLLDGLLDISRIVRGKIEVERRAVDLAAVVREVAADAAERLTAPGVAMHVDLGSAPVPVFGDPVRLTQVVDNLLTNACKFTPAPGAITVRLTTEGGAAVLTVHDTGIGIDAELLPQVFEVFQQGYQKIDRSQGGLGLGLALVRLLVQIHGGEVSAASPGPGLGSTFTVRLPLTHAERLPAPPRQAPATSLRVLLVEDNEDAAAMLRLAMEHYGHTVTVSHSGAEGMALARRDHPDLVLCDLGLPDGVTGYDVAAALRNGDDTRDITIVALSGYGRPEDKQRAVDAGFDAHLTKPVSLDDLAALLQRLDPA